MFDYMSGARCSGSAISGLGLPSGGRGGISVDTPALGAGARKSVGVRIPPPAYPAAPCRYDGLLWGSELTAMRTVSKTVNPGSNPGSPVVESADFVAAAHSQSRPMAALSTGL